MKKILLTLLAFAFVVIVNAQNKNQFKWNKKNMTEIGLSAEQQAKVDSIKTASSGETEKIKSDSALSEDGKKTKLAEIQKKRSGAIEALLTDEQKKKVEEIKARVKTGGDGNP